MIVYKTTNTVNGKIYVGQDSNNNPNYLGSGKLLKKAIEKYGKEFFIKEALEECADKNELNEQEIFWISSLNSTDRKVGYNISNGGDEGDRAAGHKIAKEGIYNYWIRTLGQKKADLKWKSKCKKISDHNKKNGTALVKRGRYKIWVEKYGKNEADRRKENWKKKISNFQKEKMTKGWTHSDDAKKRISEAAKGRKHSEESKQKMRKPKPEGFGEKISKALKGRKGNPSPTKKKVIQLDLSGKQLKIWNSLIEAEKELGIYNLSACCKGKQQTAGGFKWKYYE